MSDAVEPEPVGGIVRYFSGWDGFGVKKVEGLCLG